MSKPTDSEFEAALNQASYMREHDKDPHFMAKSLLNMAYRLNYFEELLQAVEKYIYFGQEEGEHQKLLQLVDRIRKEELRIKEEDEPPTFGL